MPKKVAMKKVETVRNIPSKFEIGNILELIDFEGLMRKFIRDELERWRLGGYSMPKQKQKITEIKANNKDGDPMDIDLVRLENVKDLACVNGRIKDNEIQTLVDSCSNVSVIREEECKEFGIEIDESKKHRLSGVSTKYKSLGTANITVALDPGCIIMDDFAVVGGYPHREIIISRPCLRRYNYDLHESRKHMAITCDGKDFFIPIVPDKIRSIEPSI